ncbi:methyltransferase, FxLD system [Catenuloplanes atrovinosus]|uniref:Protein-L-isoaspartate O-methyltransferase n=1 Tax=Catenuloplanes atrovinosus TaxID=137266 RepID=A0AAE3YSP7_9ACTN|nr:methyltransferase, FxLD system [Catenuloplanes atrovinosus]MDR7277728.1 methyltransferase of FxLD system [Catenuloplanes atrovinosus]
MTTDTTTIDATDAAARQQGLADYIRDRGTFTGHPRVEAAFRTVFRHQFLPGIPLDVAYGNQPVVTKTADDGTALSSASNANLVAAMLGQLQITPGDRILEIGAATGFNAALMAELTGPDGHVVTIEYDADLADGAARHLADAGYHNVTVVSGDGAHGHADHAPYQRIIVTAGAADISTAWWQQLAAGGRIVIPLRLHPSGLSRSIAFTHTTPGHLVSVENPLVCGFVPMRGTAAATERHIRLAEDVLLKIDAADQADDTALADVLRHPGEAHWTGIRIHDQEPAAHLDLWLATTSDIPFGRLSVGPVARSSGLLDPALRWAGATLHDGTALAYLAVRPVTDDENELGLIAHGPQTATLAARGLALLRQWDTDRPAVPTITAVPTPSETPHPATPGHLPRPDTLITITW